MTQFEITYIRTGSGETKSTDRVRINTCDMKTDGTVVSNIVEAIEYFEELAAFWGTYENKNAIVNISVSEF